MKKSIFLRLSGPLQSWASDKVTGNIVQTTLEPTRSALIGLLAGACGFKRGTWENWLNDTLFTVRTDNPGVISDDFHTISSHADEAIFRRRLLSSHGAPINNTAIKFTPDRAGGTSISNRTYLAGAEFLVQISNENNHDRLAKALKNPGFTSYLGRKAFAPSFPFVLGIGEPEAIYKIPLLAPNGEKTTEKNLIFSTLAPGLPPTSQLASVPTVKSREQWLEKVRDLIEPI